MFFEVFSAHFAGSKAWIRPCAGLWAAFGLALVLALLSLPALSRTVLDLDAEKQPVALADWGDYWIDPQSQLAVEQVVNQRDLGWQQTPARGIYPLLPGQSLWIRFIVPPAPDMERWLLEIPYPALDRASLYTLDSAGQWIEQRAGDLTPVNLWPTPHRHPLLVVNFNAEDPTHYILRIDNAQGFSAPIRFVSSGHVLRSEQQVSLFLGIYFGLALLGCTAGLIGAFWLRDRAYLYYAACSALIGLTQVAITGVGGLHLWPDSPAWTDRSLTVLATWMLVSLLLLNATVVSLAQRSRMLNLLVWAAALAGAGLSVALALTDSALRITLMVPFLVLVPVLMLAINLWAWRRGDRFGGWLLLSAAPFALSLSLAIARYLQWLPLSFATEQGVLASMALQMPAMLVVLVLRSQQRRENRRRIQGLDRVDPSTGLINEQVFVERMARMIARSQRLRHQGAVLMIDLVNSEQVRRDFGRRAAEELPLRVAERLLSTAREIDSAARLSGQRFGMLVEGPFSAEEAATLGPRIVARCLMPYKGLPEDCAAQIRVAYALVPRQGPTAEIVLGRLAQRLTGIPPESKRAVFMLPDYK
ncbi:MULTISPECIES: 7TM diverse intracellular signaling domain-containing protein [unclassified Polaromonas]|jgi:diguanylate cyclase (GGDEF)-like protein|uniref:sensor domain-containing diguanylate cyclase n=1 Tax=unclassified Polaromonas TaxID=2638319 RepID=UPI000BD72347|nr:MULTISPECIES: 7TM diverse intracellular signaling domain-containing protein [unclassified Polaromonas]OYY36388.1 MAG: diguanylate cyclase [Polaromonas sp. 35-63-35]OYZ22623.1 MAG: diguanylate cyclase [Polaromonas sp. 16-63-31]OYZ81161.1 MAG: diguanylate cyclase [Polaromonas sp. 24-63-21]OZA52617.1 MAG: diguanylate cyclase [Polaromonas sp. 17-63-33]OZA88524.1 MAG: diguanylate cyclase [Polaromonas sp. 39-63-25]